MAVRDVEAFVRQRAVIYDGNLDVTPGAPFDVQVIQPLVRRLGPDPFTVDLSTFINARMAQAYPELASKDGDTITDLLNKPATLLWDPIVRENTRVARNASFADPSTLTDEEADALGANFFSIRRRGALSRGLARILFAQPQNVAVSPVNFFTSRGGLHFFPQETQSIRTEEMLLNVTEGGLYYFDVNAVAESPGISYNIAKDNLISVANVPSAVQVTNPRRFRSGEVEETGREFIERIRQEIGERSLVTLRGIAAKTVDAFPEVNRLNVVGFNDAEMQRDIIVGGGLGSIQAAGNQGVIISDGTGAAFSSYFNTTEEDFSALIGSVGATSGWVLTVFDALTGLDVVKDLSVVRVVSADTIEVDGQELVIGTSSVRWTLRRRELTLSHIPGGILFPEGLGETTVTVPDDTIHVGGCYDLYTRGSDFEESTTVFESVVDDLPILSGTQASNPAIISQFILFGLRQGVDYEIGDATYTALQNAARFNYSFQMQAGPTAGTYRIIDVDFGAPGSAVELTVDPTPPVLSGLLQRWRLFDELNIDLLEPKETRYSGSDLQTVLGSDIVETDSGVDFDEYGVAEGDVLRVDVGEDAGDYTVVAAPLPPTNSRLQLDRPMTRTASGLSFSVFRSGVGEIVPPFVRIKQIELLDSSSQPLGSIVPYAKPVDVQSRAFQNPARGVDHEFGDARLGLVSAELTSVTIGAGNNGLKFLIDGAAVNITLTNGTYDLDGIVAELNTQLSSYYPEMALVISGSRFGIRPVGESGYVVLVDGSARTDLFGDTEVRTTGDVRSSDASSEGGWGSLEPAIDTVSGLDVIQVLDGYNIGFYSAPFELDLDMSSVYPSTASTALIVGTPHPTTPLTFVPEKTFQPQANRRVQIGTRSIGSARVYFLEPTSFEVDQDSRFSATSEDGGTIYFLPDPTLDHQRIPPLPEGDSPTDGESAAGGSSFISSSQDFTTAGIQPGDKLVVEYHPIEGSIVLTNPVSDLVGKILTFAIDDGPDKVLTFIRDDLSLEADEVSQLGVVSQINAAAGRTICSLVSSRLRFEGDFSIIIRKGSSTIVHANPYILGDVQGTSPTQSFLTDDQNNRSPHAGTYGILVASGSNLIVDDAFISATPFTSPIQEQTYKVLRSGVQRISTTEMAENEAEADLYYFDVELVSEGAGDFWNIDAQQQLTPTGYRSDGYYLTTDDENLTFSPVERPRLVMSRSILEEGVDDAPENATQLTGASVQITYDRSSLVTDIQNFAASEVERVVCSSPLSRHLIPHFVRFDLEYTGGSKEDVVVPELENYITRLYPNDTLDASDLQKIVTDRGANYIRNPLDLIAVVHNIDRTIWVQRSQDNLSTGRLSAFIPDVLNVQRNTTG